MSVFPKSSLICILFVKEFSYPRKSEQPSASLPSCLQQHILPKHSGMLHIFPQCVLEGPSLYIFQKYEDYLNIDECIEVQFLQSLGALFPSPCRCSYSFSSPMQSAIQGNKKIHPVPVNPGVIFVALFSIPLGRYHWTPPRGGGAVRHAALSTLLLSLPSEPLTPADPPGLYYSPMQWNLTVSRLDVSSSFHSNSVRMMKYSNCEEKRQQGGMFLSLAMSCQLTGILVWSLCLNYDV